MKMKLSLFLTLVLVSVTVSIRVEKLFDPFGEFLQGNILNDKSNRFHVKGRNFTTLYKRFRSTLENEDYMTNVLEEFEQRFNKTYANKLESDMRMNILKTNLRKVFKHNANAYNGKKSYTIGVNQFSDMSFEEIINSKTGFKPTEDFTNVVKDKKSTSTTRYYKASWSVDPYRAKYVTPVQNQGSCGSCVYFAAAAVVETAWARKGHKLTVLSPQQINDCARGNLGCKGGSFVPTFEYIKAHGLTSMGNYPYLAKDQQCNKQKEAQRVAHISHWERVTPQGDENALKSAFDKHGPVAVAIHVNERWARYKQGIYDDRCEGGINHAVVAVGYGYDEPSNKDYWIIKNSWGEGFGEKGYIRMRRNNKNMCKIANDPVWVA